jgi:hypothetical protein
MIVTINNIQHNVPSDLSQITLGRFVDWYTQYGKALDAELIAVFEKEHTDAMEIEIDLQLHVDKEALSWYSFFTGFDFFKCDTIELTDILMQYRILRSLLKDSETEAREFPIEIDWNEEKWAIQDFKIQTGSTMSFGEIITSKEVVRQINKIGQGKWEALVYLCCIYFRKIGEPFTDGLTSGDRFALMQSLPLNHAMAVAFFLSNSINIFKKHLLSFEKEEMTTQLPNSMHTMKNGDG